MGWHVDALADTTVLLATADELERLTGPSDPIAASRAVLARGPDLVVVKRGAAGALAVTPGGALDSPAFPATLRDATGAGDSLDAAVIDGHLRGLPPRDLLLLGNAAGAAKVEKRGTGHNLPTAEEIAAVLDRAGLDSRRLLRGAG
jgi:sugar/nucleoside kinase (ribokinase family)